MRAGLVMLLVLSPWLIRNVRLTGQPFFTLQAHAELVKNTRTWPGYQVYRQLTPQPMVRVLREDPVPVLRKAVRGLGFFGRESHRFFPPVLLSGFVIVMIASVWRRARHGRWPGPDRLAPALTALTLFLLSAQYAFFDHSLRHLLVLLPVLAWDTAYVAATRWRWVALVLLLVFLPPARLPGWDQSARQAAVAERTRPWAADAAQIAAGGVYFFDYSAGPWFLDHPGVWRSPAAVARIPLLLEQRRIPLGRAKESP